MGGPEASKWSKWSKIEKWSPPRNCLKISGKGRAGKGGCEMDNKQVENENGGWAIEKKKG